METMPLNVLIVEDEVSIRSLMEMEFQDLGYITTGVGTVGEALNLINKMDFTIDLCIFDLKLPDGDGLTLLQNVKAIRNHVPVILMTGHGNKSTVIEALKRGAYDYIEKPFSISNDLFPVLQRVSNAIKLQKENRILNEAILHNSKLTALGELSATVLHDIRGPLSLIQVVCEDIAEQMANSGPIPTQEMHVSLDQIRKACDRIRRLGEHLRGYSRKDVNEIQEDRELELLLDDSLFMVQQKVRKYGIKVKKLIEPSAISQLIRCFPNKFEQVIMNLMSNACDAMNNSIVKELCITARCEGAWLFIDVKDSGTGMSKEVQEKIYENFFTTKPAGEGTGLGLKIVRNIIQEHSGELILNSELGKGTTFTIKVPLKGLDSVETKDQKAA